MYKVAVLTISDRCSAGKRKDESGMLVQDIIKGLPSEIVGYDIVSDDANKIKERLEHYCDVLKVNLVLTTGGTGFTSRDNTPEATKDILEREVPGISEVMRLEGFKNTPRAMLSRGVSGLRKKTLIINLPGSPKGAKESLTSVLPGLMHGIDMILGKDHST